MFGGTRASGSFPNAGVGGCSTPPVCLLSVPAVTRRPPGNKCVTLRQRKIKIQPFVWSLAPSRPKAAFAIKHMCGAASPHTAGDGKNRGALGPIVPADCF